jgi:DNA-binding MarR family transcriptional regulator
MTDEDTAARMRAVIARLGRGLRQTHAGNDLSPSQYEVLATISIRGRVRLGDLAAIEGLNPTLLSRIVGRLEDAGLVAREQDPDDRRVAHVSVTPAGGELHLRIRGERTDALAVALDALPQDELARIEEALPVLEALASRVRERAAA